jgi:tetratricopeptide (TPR) repeat protein
MSRTLRFASSLPVLLWLASAWGTHRIHLQLAELRLPEAPAGAQPVPVSALRLLCLGQVEMLSDIYVLRAIQHFGDRSQHRLRYPLLAGLLEHASALDPKSLAPYLLAGTTLTYADMEYARAIRLLHQGASMRPDSWVVPFYGGFYAYFFLSDYPAAIAALRQAAAHPAAPDHINALVDRLVEEYRNK